MCIGVFAVGLHKFNDLVTIVYKTEGNHDFQNRYEFLLSQPLAPQRVQIGGVQSNPEPVRELKRDSPIPDEPCYHKVQSNPEPVRELKRIYRVR